MSLFIYQAGGEVVRQREDGKWTCAFDEDGAVDGLEFFSKLAIDPWERDGVQYEGVAKLYRDPGSLGTDEMWRDFARGNTADVAMVITVDDDYTLGQMIHIGGLDPYTLGIAPVPAGPAGQATIASVQVFGVNV